MNARRVELDLGSLILENRVDEGFDELIAKNAYRNGPLPLLKEIRGNIGPNEQIVLAHPRPITDESAVHLLIESAGFEIEEIRSFDETEISIVPRDRASERYDYDMELVEMIDHAEILACHEFAHEVYYYRDFNYDYEVARQFDPNADMFAIVDSRGTILAIGRSILRAPGYYCPFMYATQPLGEKVTVPIMHRKICEVMGLYREGKHGIIAFKRLMTFLAKYASKIVRVDSVWTTYDESDEYTGTYYKKKLLMEETGHTLTYRDFGGSWKLVMSERMEELASKRTEMFVR